MSQLRYLLSRGNRSLRLSAVHMRRAIIYYFRVLASLPRVATANSETFLTSLADVISRYRQNAIGAEKSNLGTLRHAISLTLRHLLQPFILIAKALVFVGAVAFVTMILAGGLVVFVLVAAQLFDLIVTLAKGFYEFHRFLLAVPVPEHSAWGARIAPYLQRYGIFAILISLAVTVIALVLSVALLKLLITLIRGTWIALLALGNAAKHVIHSIRQSIRASLRELTWRQILLLFPALLGTAIVAWAGWTCAQSDVCRGTAPWVVALAVCIWLLMIVKLKPGEGRDFSIEIFSCSIISRSSDGLTIFGIALAQISPFSISLVSVGFISIVLWQYSPYLIDLTLEAMKRIAPQTDSTPTNEHRTSSQSEGADAKPVNAVTTSNLFLSPAYWRMGSAMELTNSSGRTIQLTEVLVDEENLCEYTFVVAVGAASPDGPEALNACFSRQRASLSARIARKKIKRCEKHVPIVVYSLGESVSGISAVEARQLLAFGVQSAAQPELSADVLHQLVSEFIGTTVGAFVDPDKALQPEYCLDDSPDDRYSTPFRLPLHTCDASFRLPLHMCDAY